MQIITAIWNQSQVWNRVGDNASVTSAAPKQGLGSLPGESAFSPDLILYFGATSQLGEAGEGRGHMIRELADRYPRALCCGCSTAGEIIGHNVYDDTVVAALVRFDSTRVRAVAEPMESAAASKETGRRIALQLLADDLQHILVISEGLSVNGTSLLAGFRDILPGHVKVTGGLAGDGARFDRTLVGLGAQLKEKQIVGIGFYGSKLQVSFASEGGWEAFGPSRKVTRSVGNVLYELDGVPALTLYKRYLGERASGLPATGLLFPLELSTGIDTQDGLVRTILSVNEAGQSLTFAGDIPQNWYARLMKASSFQLVSGAETAGVRASACREIMGDSLAILVSCVGRRLVLGQRAEEEIEAVARSLKDDAGIIGFYSYGETCPKSSSGFSELHNQTMTVTVIGEVE